jgi:hypothetical protein
MFVTANYHCKLGGVDLFCVVVIIKISVNHIEKSLHI